MNLGKVGFIFDSGAFAGAYSAGHIRALEAKGIRPEFVQGVSVGVLSAGKLLSTGWDVGKLEKKWRDVEKWGPMSIFDRNWTGLLRRAGTASLFNNEGLSRLLVDDLDTDAILNSTIEFQMVTFNEKRHRHQVFSNHEQGFKENPKLLKSVMLASVAMQGFLPPVMINGEWHSDGITFRIGKAIRAKCDTIFILSNSRLGMRPQDDTGNMRWYLRFILETQLSSDLLKIRDMKEAIHRGYDLVENHPSSAFDGVRSIQRKIGRRIKKLTGDLSGVVTGDALENIFLPHRVVFLTPSSPIATLGAINFRQPDPRNSYPGDISSAIEQCSVLSEDFWSKF